MRELGGSAMFAAHFRENAARALLLPRRRGDARTPLWQMRQRAADLLAVASRFGSFPILLETYREILQDVFDLPGAARGAARRPAAPPAGDLGRDRVGLAVCALAAVRLHRRVHVRGRRAAGRASRPGAGAGPRAAARAARAGGPARAARSVRAAGARARAAVAGRAPRSHQGPGARPAAPTRRPVVTRKSLARSSGADAARLACRAGDANGAPCASASPARSAGSRSKTWPAIATPLASSRRAACPTCSSKTPPTPWTTCCCAGRARTRRSPRAIRPSRWGVPAALVHDALRRLEAESGGAVLSRRVPTRRHRSRVVRGRRVALAAAAFAGTPAARGRTGPGRRAGSVLARPGTASAASRAAWSASSTWSASSRASSCRFRSSSATSCPRACAAIKHGCWTSCAPAAKWCGSAAARIGVRRWTRRPVPSRAPAAAGADRARRPA